MLTDLTAALGQPPEPNTALFQLRIEGTCDVRPGGIDGRKLAAIRRLCRNHVQDGRAAEPAGPLVEKILALIDARDVEL